MEKFNKITEFFSALKFSEKEHAYLVKEEKLKHSVSALVKKFVKKVDFDKISFIIDSNKGFKKGTTKQIWKLKSENACARGNKAHFFGEIYPFNKNIVSETPLEKAIKSFWDEMPAHIVPVCTELSMYHKEAMFGGTADILLYNLETNKYIIADYKGLPVNTKIFTTTGWTTMGEIKVGEKVFDKDGLEVKVLNTSEVKNKKCYKIVYDNNETIVSDFEHRWLVRKGNNKKQDVLTTEEIFTYLKKTGKKSLSYKTLRIDNPKPLQTKEKSLPLDPYVLGMWLGDGHSKDSKITQMNPLVWTEIEKRGYKLGKDVSQGKAGKAQTRSIFNIMPILKEIGVYQNKHIPDQYLLSSEKQRLELLKGFMDADGYYNKTRKRYVMATTRKKQVDFFVPLLGSLGIKSTVLPCIKYCNNKKIQGWDVCFTTNINPFLCRNQNIKQKLNKQHSYRRIVSVEEVPSVPTRCIEVDSGSHTFLYGESFTVTHNTNEELFKNFKGQKLKAPLDNLLDTKFNKYQIQFSFYQILLQQIPEVEVESRILVWVKDSGKYELFPTEDLTDVLSEYIDKTYMKNVN